MKTDTRIEVINSHSSYLEDVIRLGRSCANTLGHMPRGGFLDHAKKKCILVAITSDEKCVGYLMYRISSNQATIVHLCVDKAWRDTCIAKQLVDQLIRNTRNLYGIKLACRDDYNLEKMWASFGFTAQNERPGKSKDGKILTDWYLNHGHPNLLTILTQKEIGNKLGCAIDANVFYDLIDETGNRENSRCLMADWLQSEVELCLTDEIDNEINRCKDLNRKKDLRKLAEQFKRLPYSQEKFTEVRNFLRQDYPEDLTANDASDIGHLARAIASDAQFFVTRDTEILEKEAVIYDRYELTVLRPSDLVARLDELRRELEYQPVRLAGTSIETKLIQSGQQKLLIETFLSYATGERKVEFKDKLREFVSSPSKYQCHVAWENEKPVSLFVYEIKEGSLDVHILRVNKDHELKKVLIQHLLLFLVKVSTKERRLLTKISDSHLSNAAIQAITQDSFFKASDGWQKINLPIASSAIAVSAMLSQALNSFDPAPHIPSFYINELVDPGFLEDDQRTANLERALYPAKVTDAELPSFIIPIRPEWAEHLFDEGLAGQGLFGAQKELALSREVVYYRSAKNSGGIKAPSRILWYVSNGKGGYCEVKAIRACSRLETVVIDKPKPLFRQFKRLGVYKFKDVLSTAQGSLDNNIMAIRFSDTEMFNRPISIDRVQRVLGNKSTFPSPQKISKVEFKSLYNMGMYRQESRQ